MKNVTIKLIKKNRKYFACTQNGYKAKLIIDEKSENLELGEHDLNVDDMSVRSKYGTDLIYKMHSELVKGEICTLTHFEYNSVLVERCRELGGKWDAEEKAWIFSDIVEDQIEKLDELYNEDIVTVEIKAIGEVSAHTDPVRFLGYTVALATGRDSGAKLGSSVSMIEGGIGSSGSFKNWRTSVNSDSVFRLKCPKGLLEEGAESIKEDWTVKIIK